jgi:hypothetical protein
MGALSLLHKFCGTVESKYGEGSIFTLWLPQKVQKSAMPALPKVLPALEVQSLRQKVRFDSQALLSEVEELTELAALLMARS